MTRSCTIIISHFESLNFLYTCIKQIRKFKNENISQHIIVADQSRDLWHNNVVAQYWGDEDITIIKTPPLYSGFGIDFLFHHDLIKSEYVAQLHTDAFPISKSWILLCIKLIEENNFSFVGQLHFIADGTHSIYPSAKFFSMSPTFNVARTETYKEMSLHAGFTRFHNRPQSELKFLNHDWDEWSEEDYDHRGSDDDVVAFCWEDRHREHDKLGLAITGFIEPSFGRIIDGIVFHFGSCRESIPVLNSMSAGYRRFANKICNGYSDELIDEMVELAKANQPPQTEILRRNHWDGKLKISSPPSEEINKRIEELKNE